MRVVHVLPKFSAQVWGGAEALVAGLARSWPGGNFEIWTCRLQGDSRRDAMGTARITRFGALYPGGRMRVGDGKAGLAPMMLARLALLPRTQTVVHVHCHNRLAAAVVAATQLLGLKTVLTIHSSVRKLEPRWRYWLPNEFPLRAAHAVTAVSEAVGDQVRSVAGRTDVQVIPNGVELEWLRQGDRARGRCALGLGEDTTVILFCGRISRVKNLHALLDAVERLAQDIQVQLLIVGPAADRTYTHELQCRAAASGKLRARVSFSGPVPPMSEHLADLYAACDVVALPSLWEAQAVTALESWAAGRAVVAADVGGLGAMVRRVGFGWLWDPRSGAAELARQLVCALETTRHDPTFAHRARLAAEAFEVRHTVQAYRRLYERLLQRRLPEGASGGVGEKK